MKNKSCAIISNSEQAFGVFLQHILHLLTLLQRLRLN